MNRYIMRLDDAATKMDIAKWNRMEQLLDRYSVKPLVGVIPDCKDPMMDQYAYDDMFWEKVHGWIAKGWTIALHGYDHVYCTESGGINPVNARSEFAGLPLEAQKEKIRDGIRIFQEHGITPDVFFAPSHTFDLNTIEALKQESDIHIISDTVANKPYSRYGMTFVPQQSGTVRKLPFHTVTFCYHPNVMAEDDFIKLEEFLRAYSNLFVRFPTDSVDRRKNVVDKALDMLYFLRRINRK